MPSGEMFPLDGEANHWICGDIYAHERPPFFTSFDSNVSSRDRQKILHINNDDIAITRAIVEAGKLLDVQALNHLVIGRGRFVSLKERGLGFG